MAEQEKAGQAAQATLTTDEFLGLLKPTFKPQTAGASEAIRKAVTTLAGQALQESVVISDDALSTIRAMIEGIDAALTKQINLILHNEKFQKLESAWRGLSHLVTNTESSTTLKLRVLNVSKQEIAKSLGKYKGTNWDQSPFFKQIYEAEYGVIGGQPFGCLVGDYYFDHSPTDVAMLGQISQIAAAAHCPFISAASPTLMGMESWQEIVNPRDLAKIFTTPDYAAWNSLRQSDDSKYIGLTAPRFLARLPYGQKTSPVDEFDFEEDATGGNSANYVWANSAYAMAANINRSFALYGWCTSIRGVESGGTVENLPVHTFPSDEGGLDVNCPTEVAISDRRDNELSKCGLLPLLHRKNTDTGVFIGGQSLKAPAEYMDPDATASEQLSCRLPYLFAVSRFAHYLKCIVRDKLGSFKEREDMQYFLHTWIQSFVLADPKGANEAQRAMKPLSDAQVIVEEVEGNPGFYSAKFHLRPHFQLEGLTVSLSLVSKLPSVRGS